MERPWKSNLGWLIAVLVLLIAIIDLIAPGVDVEPLYYVLGLAVAILI
jgi:hypothetical protein